MDRLDIEPALDLAAEAWGKAPFIPFYLDQEKPDEWPDPWTLISENYYCDLARALGLLYTIHLTRHGAEHDLMLRIMRRPVDRYQYNLVFVDGGKYVLNLQTYEVVNTNSLPSDLYVMADYRGEQLRLELY